MGFLPWRDAEGQTRESDVLAARLAFSELNARGGLEIGGRIRNVRLVVAPTSDGPEEALENATRLVNQERVVALVGPYTSSAARAVASFVETVSIPMLTPTATAPDVTKDRRFAFRATFVDEIQGRAMAAHLRTDLKVDRAALLYDVTRDYSVGIAEAFRAAFTELGGDLVFDSEMTPGAPDIDELMRRVEQSNASVLFLPNAPTVVMEIVERARAVGLQARLAGSDTWSVIVSSPESMGYFEGAHYVSAWHPDAPDATSRRFVAAYRESTGETPYATQAITYDAFGLLFAAMARSETASPSRIRDALADLRGYEGVTGAISFRGSGDPDKPVMILEVEADGPHFETSIRAPALPLEPEP